MTPRPADVAPKAFIRAGVVASFYRLIKEKYGEVVDDIFRQCRLAPSDLTDPDALLSYRKACVELPNKLALVCGDPCLGLHCGAAANVRNFGALGYVLHHSPTLATAFANLARYYGVMQSASTFAIRTCGAITHVVYRVHESDLGEYRHDAELTLALTAGFVRDATGLAEWAPSAVNFAHTAPADAEPYQRYFNAPVHFRSTEHALVFPSSDLELPLLASDPGLLHVLQEHIEESLLRLPKTPASNFLEELRQHVISTIHSGDLGIESLAQRFNVRVRTLQRRLRDSGLTYVDLLSSTRCELAKQYLADPQFSLSEVAFLIGYSEQSAFNRAFRNWTAETPLSYRRRLHSPST